MKKQKVLTRKGKALRRIARFLVILLLVNHVFGVGFLLPIQAVFQQQQREGVPGLMRVVDRDWMLELSPRFVRYLTQNEKVTMMANTRLYFLYGWMAEFGTALDCTTGEPLYAAMDSLRKDENSLYYFWGRVDDPEIDCVVISLCHQEYHDGQASYPEDFRYYANGEDWLEQDGRQYFVIRQQVDWPHKGRIHAFAIAMSKGQELYRFEISEGSASHFG